ncbi:MAG: hypothetical protein GF315_10835 [candidate division Zixibacteria bacterium]|nr:hypothetical protein [candidate division Zixibacteria bacterium]
MKRHKKINPKSIKTYSFNERPTKSQLEAFAKVPASNWTMEDFIDGLPQFLKANELKGLISDIESAKDKRRQCILMMGAHSLKVGLAPVIIDLIDNGFITHLALNSACVIHDYEFAFYGRSSEDVGDTLQSGMFGMVSETPEFLHEVVSRASGNEGLGTILGQSFIEADPELIEVSIFAAAVRNEIPVTVHVAIGADTIHQHPDFDAKKWGKLSGEDFLILAESCKDLNDGGVVINLGSAVILPEVFLKALNLARNIHGKIGNFSAANLDMIQHYRPLTNVVNRPTLPDGKKYTITGHFEILIPLIAWALKENP